MAAPPKSLGQFGLVPISIFIYTLCEQAGKTEDTTQMSRLFQAYIGHLCYNKQNLMCWLISNSFLSGGNFSHLQTVWI